MNPEHNSLPQRLNEMRERLANPPQKRIRNEDRKIAQAKQVTAELKENERLVYGETPIAFK
jgi:hypothetical protein